MSEHQRENIISLISLLTVSTTYFSYIYSGFVNSSLSGTEELKYWAGAILAIIPIRIILQIILIIIFKIIEAIANNGKVSPDIKDERDKLIELRGDNISGNFFVFCFVVSLVGVYYFSFDLSMMFIFIFIAGYISELLGIIAKIYFYNKGF
jgi:hypothetical protein